MRATSAPVQPGRFSVPRLLGVASRLKAKKVDPATAKVIYVPGDPTDGNAKQFKDGAVSVMSKAGIKPEFSTPGSWLPNKVQTYFEQAYTAVKGNVDILIALVMNTGAAIGAQIGAISTQYFAGPKIRMAFVPLPLIGAAIVIYTMATGHKL